MFNVHVWNESFSIIITKRDDVSFVPTLHAQQQQQISINVAVIKFMSAVDFPQTEY